MKHTIKHASFEVFKKEHHLFLGDDMSYGIGEFNDNIKHHWIGNTSFLIKYENGIDVDDTVEFIRINQTELGDVVETTYIYDVTTYDSVAHKLVLKDTQKKFIKAE